MRIKFWGVRGSVPTPGPRTLRYGGNTPCVEVRCKETLLILDAGTGLRELGNALLAAGKPVVAHLLIGHTHWDHLQGFPFFAPFYVKGTTLRIYGCGGADRSLEAVLTGQMALPYFPVLLSEARAGITFHELDIDTYPIGDARVTTRYTNHPGVGLAYRVECEGRSLVYLCDTEPYHELAAVTEEPGHGIVGVTGQQLDLGLAEFASGADAVIADAPYDREEYLERRGWGHGCVDDVVSLAVHAKAKRLYLFHHDPSHSDEKVDEMVAYSRALIRESAMPIECEGAREGMEVVL